MIHVLILGASGQIARHVVHRLAGNDAIHPTLFLRDANKLADLDTDGMTVIEADVDNSAALAAAMEGQDIIYANLFGDMGAHARKIVDAMEHVGVRRLIFVSSLGIYDEVPGAFGEWNRREIGAYLPPYRAAADIIEASDLDYTILRPAWLSDHDEVDYEITAKGEPFRGTEISRKSVADFILKLLADPAQEIGGNLGMNKPHTDGPKPAFL